MQKQRICFLYKSSLGFLFQYLRALDLLPNPAAIYLNEPAAPL